MNEYVASTAPGGIGFSVGGARAVLNYDIPADSLINEIPRLIGTTQSHENNHSLKRVLPKAHPQFPWMFTERITEIKGYGKAELDNALHGIESQPALSLYAKYPVYRMTVEFMPRPYALITDPRLEIIHQTLTYYKDNGDTSSFLDAHEYERFVDYEISPNTELVTAQQGQCYLVAANSNLTPPGTPKPHGFSSGAYPRITIPQHTMKLIWNNVPYEWVNTANSYALSMIGRVNQLNFYGFSPGALLYLGCQVKRYTPAFPSEDVDTLTSTIAFAKLCDVEYQFLATQRPPAFSFTPGNRSWIARGHNLMPWLNGSPKGFYYVVTPDPTDINNKDKWEPTFKSFPFQWLFLNPSSGYQM